MENANFHDMILRGNCQNLEWIGRVIAGRCLRVLLFILGAVYSANAYQAGELDESYQVDLNGGVVKLAVLADGRVYVAGSFTRINGVNRPGLARLNEDGTLDSSFDPGSGPGIGNITSFAPLPNGDLVVVGNFTNFNGAPQLCVVRLKPDGTVDPAFRGLVADGWPILTKDGNRQSGWVGEVAAQSDGKIWISGPFYFENSDRTAGRNSLARLNADGTMDNSVYAEFAGWGGANGYAGNILIGSNDHLFVGGGYSHMLLESTNNISYTAVMGGGAMALQPDGPLLVEGINIDYFFGAREFFGRTSTDGSAVALFSPKLNGGSATEALVSGIWPQADGKVVVVGIFTAVGKTPRRYIARLNKDGSLDEHFYAQATTEWPPSTIVAQADGAYLIGGIFSKINGVSRPFLARLHGEDRTPRPPSIQRQPAGQEVSEGYGAVFSVQADGPSLFYQWRLNGAQIEGATNELITRVSAKAADAGDYTVVITNAWGAVTSAPAALKIKLIGEALNARDLQWEFSRIRSEPEGAQVVMVSGPAWICQTNSAHDGQEAIKNPYSCGPVIEVDGCSDSILQTSVTGPGQISFWFRGRLFFGIANADSVPGFAGPAAWHSATNFTSEWQDLSQWLSLTMRVPPGKQKLVWYGGDTVYLDEIVYTPAPEGLTLTIERPTTQGGECQLLLQGTPDAVIQIDQSFDLATWDPLVKTTNATGTMRLTLPAQTNNSCTFYRAVQ